MRRLFFAALAGMLFACGRDQPSKPAASTAPDPYAESAAWTALQQLPEPDTLVIPSDEAGDSTVIIMPVGTFHGDEIEEDAVTKTWCGLFQSADGRYYLKKDPGISQEHVHDPVLDDDESLPGTGWRISTSGRDSCLLLFSGIKHLAEGNVDTPLGVRPRLLYPGEQWTFRMGAHNYTLKAEGVAKTIEDEEKVVVNYRLWLENSENGQQQRQLLVAQPSFDDAMIELLWAGDLDRDGKPDFVFNLSNHYNMNDIGLFLSSGAAKGELVRFVTRHISVGC